MLRSGFLFAALLGLCAVGCKKQQGGPAAPSGPVIGVAFETLQTEYWVVGFEAIKSELEKRNARVLEAIADGDMNKQLEQIQNFITRGVDGIIVAPKDAKGIIPALKAANAAKIPIVVYNRPPAASDARATTIVADNFAIAKATVARMCQLAKESGKKHKAAILMGDLGDMNAIGRRDGFEAAVKECGDVVEVVSRIPTEWNQEKAMAGITNALQAHPDISFIFTSSDFMLPSITSALRTAGRYKKAGEEGHVILGSFDGDAMAYEMLAEGYLDADGVQDVYFESSCAAAAVLDMAAGKPVAEKILDPGFVVDRAGLEAARTRMWGAKVALARTAAKPAAATP